MIEVARRHTLILVPATIQVSHTNQDVTLNEPHEYKLIQGVQVTWKISATRGVKNFTFLGYPELPPSVRSLAIKRARKSYETQQATHAFTRVANLIMVTTELARLECVYHLFEGTLLAIVRDKQLFPSNDDDLAIHCDIATVMPHIERLGFQVVTMPKNYTNFAGFLWTIIRANVTMDLHQFLVLDRSQAILPAGIGASRGDAMCFNGLDYNRFDVWWPCKYVFPIRESSDNLLNHAFMLPSNSTFLLRSCYGRTWNVRREGKHHCHGSNV